MTILVKNLIPRIQMGTAAFAYYTAVNAFAVIDKLTLTNTSAAPVIVSLYLPASGGTASNSNCILYSKSIAAGETYTCPEAVGQSMAAGGSIVGIASSAAAITISATGREIT